MEQEEHRQPEEGTPQNSPDESSQVPEVADAAAISERERRRRLFERYVALGINPEDAMSAVEIDDYLDAAHQQAEAVSSGPRGETAALPGSSAETGPDPPRIFVTDADDEVARCGITRGGWLDAAVDADELKHAVWQLLPDTASTGTPAYRITGTSGFTDVEISGQESLDSVARIARGIVEHGRAFVAYIDTWGSSQEAVDEFSQYFVGSYSSAAAWAETEVEAYGWWEILDEHLPPVLRSCLRIDFDRLGRELSYDAHVVQDEAAGQVHVFRLHP